MSEKSKFRTELENFIDKMTDLKNVRIMYGIEKKSPAQERYDALYDVAIEYLRNYLWKYDDIKNIELELKNDPLSWDDLREFIDRPVYLKRGSNSYWIIVKELRYGKDGYYILSDRDNPYPIAYCEFYRKERP